MGIISTIQDVKTAGIAGKKMEYLKDKINELEKKSKN
jgi:hypothetical protein